MRNITSFPVIIFLILILASCGESPCIKTVLRYSLIGFSDAESDTIIIRRFTKNTSQLKDTFFFDETNAIRFNRSNDTLTMTAYSSTALLESNYDYQLYFPQPNKLFNITDIFEEQLSEKKNGIFNTKKTICVNRINNCRLNGQLVNFSGWNELIYLRR
jgi:hypothetical protein